MGLQKTTHGREEGHDTVLKVEAEEDCVGTTSELEKEDPKA